MATRYPLIIDTTDDNKIKELPDGDNLNLSGNNIVNVVDITASGTVTAGSLSVDTANFSVAGQTLDSVAFTGNYNDLDGLPVLFSGNYSDLQNKPILKNTTLDLDDVSGTTPLNNQILVYKENLGYYQPENLPSFSSILLSDLQNVTVSGLTANDFLKYNGVFWTNAPIDFSSLTGTITAAIETNSFISTDPQIRLGPNVQVSTYGIGIGSNSKIDGYGVGVGVNSQADSYGTTVGAFAGTKHVDNNSAYTVAVGAFSQQNSNPGDTTGTGAIAIGVLAGDSNQGANAVAIGRYAGRNNQAEKSIVINATDADLENTIANSLVIKPIREAEGTSILQYNKDTGEVTYSDLIISDVKGSIFGDDSTPLLDAVNNILNADVDAINVSTTQFTTGSIRNNPTIAANFTIAAQPGTIAMSMRGADETGTTQGTPLTIRPGNNTDATAQGGELLIIGGAGNPGGEVEIYGGNASNGGTGGATYVAGGSNIDGSGNGGNLHLRGGRDLINDTTHGSIYIGDTQTSEIYIHGSVNLPGTIIGNSAATLIDGVNNTISAAYLSGQLPSLDASNLYNIQLSNSTYIDYGYDGLNNFRTVLDLAPIVQSDGTDLTLSITVSPSYTKVLIELNVKAINLTNVSSECYVALQRSTDSGATWTTLDSCQTTAVEATSSSFANILLGSFVRWIDVHGQTNGSTVQYRFINNTDATIGSGANDQIRIYYENTSCVASAREVK